MTDVSAVFTTALDLLRERGWAQGAYETTDGRVCLSRAMMLAAREQGLLDQYGTLYGPIGPPVLQVINEQFPGGPAATQWNRYGSMPEFNDENGRTFADIKLVLDKAAARE